MDRLVPNTSYYYDIVQDAERLEVTSGGELILFDSDNDPVAVYRAGEWFNLDAPMG